jgi:hypothetical protein
VIGFARGKSAGAVYKAILPFVGAIVPRTELPFGTPLRSHANVVPFGTQKLAVKVCIWPIATRIGDGTIEFETAHVIVIVADAATALSAALVAVRVTFAGTGGTAGAE